MINCTFIWLIFLKYKFILKKMTMRHIIKCWLTYSIINDWVNIKFLFWSLNVCITSRDFSNALLISRCLISFKNRKLNMQTFVNTSFLLTDWKTSFSMSLLISFCLIATNWESTICTIKWSLKTTASNEIETKARSTVALNTKLKNAIDAKYFRSRSRSRLNEFERISNFDF